MAAQEEELQSVVFPRRHRRPIHRAKTLDGLVLVAGGNRCLAFAARSLTADDVGEATAADGHQPGESVLRHALLLPLRRRGQECVLRGVLTRLELPVATDEDGKDPWRQLAEGAFELPVASRHISVPASSMIGRTSMAPPKRTSGHRRGEREEEPWTGWWGPEPPFHHPVFVLTHYAREPIPMAGGTTFYFVTGGIREAFDRAMQSAGGSDVRLGGGAATIQQFLRARLIDELHVAIVPVLLGRGERLFTNIDAAATANLGMPSFQCSPAVVHVRLRGSTNAHAATANEVSGENIRHLAE